MADELGPMGSTYTCRGQTTASLAVGQRAVERSATKGGYEDRLGSQLPNQRQEQPGRPGSSPTAAIGACSPAALRTSSDGCCGDPNMLGDRAVAGDRAMLRPLQSDDLSQQIPFARIRLRRNVWLPLPVAGHCIGLIGYHIPCGRQRFVPAALARSHSDKHHLSLLPLAKSWCPIPIRLRRGLPTRSPDRRVEPCRLQKRCGSVG